MSTNQYLMAEEVAGKYCTTDTSGVAVSEVHPVPDEWRLRNVVFAGIRTKQLEVKEGTAYLSNEASAFFVSQLAAATQESIVLTPGISRRELNETGFYKKAIVFSIAEYLRELAAATKAINDKYAQVGGFLGNPVTDVEFGGKNYEIPYREYEHGAIYVTPHGVHEVHGAIYQKYVALGAETGFLGFPETDELGTTFGTGRFNHFQKGSIYWSPATGAWSIHGHVRDKWWQMGAERGYLGFPVSDIEQVSSGNVSFFERGSLVRTFDGIMQDYPDSVRFMTNLEGGNVKCSTEFGMNSRGEWFFKGHLHNAGFAGNVTTVATSPNFVGEGGRSFVVPAERSLGGTLDSEDRNDDWDQKGQDDFIRDNWGFMRYASIKTVMKTNVTVGDVVKIILPALAVIGAAIFGAHIASKRWCGPVWSMSRDPRTGETESHLGWVLVEPNEPCPPGYQ